MKYHPFFVRKLGKMSEKLSSDAVVIGALADESYKLSVVLSE